MKLHLPSGLRKALIAVLSALPVFSVATSITAPTAYAGLADYVKTTTTGSVIKNNGYDITIGEYSSILGVTTVFNEISGATIENTGTPVKTNTGWPLYIPTGYSDPKVLVQGMLNTVDHSTLYSKNSSVTLNGVEEGWGVDEIMKSSYVKGLVRSKLADYGFTSVSDDDLKILLDQSANIVENGSTLQAGTNVKLDAKVNMVSSSTLTAGQNVQVTGGINAMLGANIDGKNVTFTGSAIDLGKLATLYPLVSSKLAQDNNGIMGIPVATVDSLVGALKDKLKGVEASANMLMGGKVNATLGTDTENTGTVTLSGTANVITGGTNINAANDIILTGEGAALPLNELYTAIKNKEGLMDSVKSILPAGIDALLPLVEPMLDTAAMQDLQGNFSVNLVHGGGTDLIAQDSVTMTALGNVVSKNALVQGKDVTMTGLANIVALKTEGDTGATVMGSNSVNMDGMLNVVYDGGRVMGGVINMGMNLNDKTNPFSSTLPLDDLAASITGSGMLGAMLGSDYGTMANGFVNALPDLIGGDSGPGYFNMNLVMGKDTLVSGNNVNINGVVSMLSDRAKVHGTNGVTFSGVTNIVTDGTTITSGNGINLSGTLNFLSHLTLADAEGLLKNGKLPNRGITTTTLTSNGHMNLWGTANVLMGDVKVESKGGNVLMGGKNDPILNVNSLTIDQCVELAKTLGLDLSNDTTIGNLLALAGQSKDPALVAQAKAALAEALSYYNGVEIPSELLSSNVNVVMEGAKVYALNGAVTMNGTANVVLGNSGKLGGQAGQVTHVQGQTVTMNGLANLVVGGADVVGTNIVMHGVDRHLHLGAIGGYLVDHNMLGGLELPTGTLTVLNSVNGSVNLVYGGSTNVHASNTFTMDALANIVAKNAHVDAGGKVTMSGALNVVAAGAVVNANNISMLGTGSSVIDWTAMMADEKYGALAQMLQDRDPNINLVAEGAQLNATNMLRMDGSANVIMGGADLKANTIYITSGGANVVADTTLQNIADLLGGNVDAFWTGGTDETTLTATGNLTMSGLANIVNGGRVSLHAGNNVNLKGALNLVGGGKSLNPNIYAKGDVNLIGSDTIQLKPSNYLSTGYDALDKVFDKVTEEGVSLNLVAGGAKVEAGNNITMSGMISAVVDTTLSNVKDAYDNWSIAPLLAGGVHETTLTAGNSIHMDSKLNLVNGGMVSLNAGKDVTLRGVMNYVGGDAQVNADGTVTLAGAANAVLMGADITADRITLKRNDSLTETMNGLVNSFAPGVSQNVCVSAGVVAGKGTSLKANSYLHLNDNLNLVAEGALVSSQGTAHIEGTANVVMTGAAVSGKDVLMHGSFGNAVLDGATLTATNGDITLQAPGLGDKVVTIAGAVAGQLKDGILGDALDKLLPDNAYVELLKDKAHYLKTGAEILTAGGLNVVAGGADLTAEKGSIAMDGGVNVVIDTTLGNLVEAIKGDKSSLLTGGTDETTLKAGKDITLSGLANVVNGGKVSLQATETVTLYGAGNVISGNAQVSGKNVTLRGSGRTDINWASMLPVENEVLSNLLNQYDPNVNVVANGAQLKADERLWMDATANVIMGGADLEAKTIDIVSGGVNVVADTTLQNVVDAINPDGSINLDPIIAGGSDETTLKGNNITLSGLANVVNGGKVRVEATNNVTLKGAGNVISGNAQVNGKNVTLKDSDTSHDWSSLLTGTEYAQLGSLLENRNPNVNAVANGAQVKATEKLSLNGGVNVVMGGAALKGDTVSLSAGVANVLVDTKLQNINEALQSGSLDSLMAGGSDTTTVTAEKNLSLYGAANVVNGKVALNVETGNVSITGAANMLGGGATVDAKNVTVNGRDFAIVGELLDVLPSQYQSLANRLGVEELGSANVVMSGAEVNADNNVKLSGGMNVVADATLGDMLTLVDKDNTTWPGEGAETTVSAGNNISMDAKVNVVMGDKALVNAGNNVEVNGTAAIVTADAVVKAAKDIELKTASKDNGLLGGIADNVLASATMNKIADAFLPNHEDLAGKLNTYGNINVVADGATLDAGNDVKFNSSMNVVDTATVMAGNNIAFNGGNTEVTKATLDAGRDVKFNSSMNVVMGDKALVNAGNNIAFNGGVSKVTNATLSAGNQVVISGAGASTYSSRTTIDSEFTMTGGRLEAENGLIVKDNANASITNAELVLGGTSSIDAGSTLSLAELTVNPGAQIVNYGMLNLNEVVMTNVTVSNVGTMTVTGPLTMDNVTLNYSGTSYTPDANGILTGNAADAIGLAGNGALTLASTNADAISSVSFVVDAALLADAFTEETAKTFSFVLFTGADSADWGIVWDHLDLNTEFHVGVANSSWNTIVTNVTLGNLNNGNIVVNATVMVPEPTTATLSLLALAGLAARRRRRH